MLFSTVVAPETQNYVPLLKAASYLLEHIIKTTVHPYARIDARHCCYRRSIIHHLPPHECVKTTLQQSLEQNSSAAGYQCTAAAAAVLLYAVGGGVVSIDVDLYVRISGSWGVKTAVIPFSAHT